jgi:hypothetical protein
MQDISGLYDFGEVTMTKRRGKEEGKHEANTRVRGQVLSPSSIMAGTTGKVLIGVLGFIYEGIS